MTYEEQRDIIQAARDGIPIVGRKKDSDDDWAVYDKRVRDKRYFYHNDDILFNFQEYEYRVLSSIKLK